MKTKQKKRQNTNIYHQIVNGVASGRIRPGERLGENSLSARFGESRGAVREALTRLEQDGLVVRKDNVGTFVREIDDEELLEIYDVRIAIEPLVIARAVEVITEKELDELENMADQIDLVVPCHVNRDALDDSFHKKLAEISGLRHVPRLMSLGNLYARCSALEQKMVLSRAQLTKPTSRPDHRDIVNALRSRDAQAAVDALTRHLQEGRKNAVEDIERVRAVMNRLEHF
jgi:DNA-binding GntR family transcriptional regulator